MVIGTPVVLNLIPGGVNKVVHVNQVNDNIEIQFQIMNGSQPYNVTEGVSCTIRGTKGDSYGYTAEAATTVGSNVVTVTLTEQLTAVAGGCNVFELVFVGAENSMKVSTENFILAVERAALGEDTVISDSDLAYAAQVLDQLQSVGAVNAQVQQNKANIAAEVTRATAAEQTLQQNINSEASARQSADNTLQSNINVEASARATQDNVLQAEIDQLVAPSGSAPSAAEVTNARIGADGTTYDTLGNAIRGQVTDVKSAIDDMDLLSVDALKRHNGMISSSGTWTSISSSYTHVVIPINGGDEISLTVGNATGYFAILTDYTTPVAGAALPFTSDTNLNTRLTLTLTDLYKRFIVPSDAHYLCVVVKYGSVGDVTPSSIVINGIEYVGSARKTIHEAIADVNDTLDEANVIPLSAVKGYYGIAQNTGKWGLVNAQHYVTKLIRINPGDEYYIVANANGLRFGVLTKKDAIATYESVSYSAASGYTAYIDLQSNGTASGVFPDDAKYLFINTIYNDVDRTPTKLEINGIDYLKSIREVLPGIRNQVSDCITIQDVINGTISDVAWETGTWNTVVGSACTKVASATRKRTEKILQFPYPIEVRTDGTFSTSYRLVDDNGLVTESNTNYKTDTIRIPANQRFAIVVCLTSDSTADMSTYTSDEIKAGVSIGYYDLNTVVYPGVKWCAMGDSITQGYVSYINDSDVATSKVDKEAAWVTKVARKNNWQVTNLGIGGSGYVDWVNNTETVEDGRPAWYVARNTDFTPYNLVTLAYGINDWKGNHPTGTLTDSITTPETTIAAMRATIEAIIASNPHCKIIVILPMNCAGYSFNYGDESTNWGLGYRFANSGTLEEFVNALISVCNYYGIQYIDMTHYSCINRKNILDCLTDGVHPNAETHEILARELCRKITFN